MARMGADEIGRFLSARSAKSAVRIQPAAGLKIEPAAPRRLHRACRMRFRFWPPAASQSLSEPESDTARLRGALAGSLGLHVGLALVLLVGAAWLRQRPDDAPVFTLVAVPDDAGNEAAAESSPDFLSAMRQRQRAEERRAQREIAQDRRREEQARVAAERAAAAERAREQRQAAQNPTQAQTPRVVAPTMPRAQTSAAEASALDGYFSSLIVRLREAHQAPDALSDQLSAEVRFTMAANGEISGVRIVRSSGNPAFDQSVLEAFARVRMPPRPDGKTDEVRLTFRVREL
jgi:colicin import membrane protein